MTATTRPAPSRRQVLLTALGVVATLAVFVIDILLPHDYDVSYLYVITVLVAGFSGSSRVVILTAIGAWALTLGGFVAKEHDHARGVMGTELFSRSIAAVVIGLVAIVVVAATQRDRQNSELGRALLAAEGNREADKRMLAAASAVTAIGTWSIDADDDRFDGSVEAAEMHGFPMGTPPPAEELLATMPIEDRERLRDTIARAWTSGDPFREEYRVNLPDGTQRWIVAMGEPLWRVDDDESPIVRLHGTVQDITQWKEAELSASTQYNRFAQLTQSLPIIVWTADARGNIDYFNDALLRYTGATAEELLAEQWVSTVDPRDLDDVNTAWVEAVKTGKTYDIEFRVRGADGVYRWHHLTAKPELDANGDIVRWWGSSINVHATRELKERADALAFEREMILESMSDGVYALDTDWRVTYINSSAELIFGRKRHELEGKVLTDVYPTIRDSTPFAAMTAAMEDGTPARLEYFNEPIGKWLDVSVSRSTGGITIFSRDITELRQMSEQLAQSQRLEAIGQLTGGIAHDFNNLLTVVVGGADALVAEEGLTPEAREMAELIGSAAERGAELTHRLLAFARRQPLEPQSIDVAERLRRLEPLLRRTLGENITIVVGPQDASPAEVDPGQFENALLNLAINARDAMPDGGTLTLEVSTATLDETYASSHADVTPGSYVVVTVTDSGVGIDPKHMGSLFDPFFTTKDTGKGSGLGLAMVWGFVKQSGGHITVYSEAGYGTSFKMYLPTASTAPEPPPVASGAIATGPATGTILLAEDDDLVRVFAAERLRSKGYHVVAVASGPEALEALASMETIDLLFTDVIMPGGMTGRQLADAVVERRPGTPVLYASGYTENVILHNGRLDVGVRLVAKPYSTRQLIERVGDAVAEAKAVTP